MVVVLPETTEQVSRILAWCHAEGVKVVPRGSGTSLSGGALPLADAVLVGMAKFNRVLDIDYDDRLDDDRGRSEEHTSELQSLMRISYAVFCLKKKNHNYDELYHHQHNISH